MLRMPPDQLLDSKHTLREWTLWSCSGWLWLKREGFFIFGIDSTVYNQEELPLRFRSVEGFTDTEHMRHQFMTFFGSEIAALFLWFRTNRAKAENEWAGKDIHDKSYMAL